MLNARTLILNHRTVMMSATIVALLSALCFAIYSSTINGYFLADDFGYVQLYYRKNISSLATVLAADWSQGIWGFGLQEMRPVIALAYISAGVCVAIGWMLIRLAPKPIFIIASLLLSVACADRLHRANKPWREVGQLSARMHSEIHTLLKDASASSGLIFYLPGHNGKAWVWAWALPFVFRQPFSPAQLEERYQILESPGLYCCAWDQNRAPLMRQLIERPIDSYLFFVGPDSHLVKKKIPQERLRARLSEILAGADWNKTWMAEATAASH